ncbi:MAG: ATP-binding protein [Proteobacteria bacterium]|nr:ATP-binding protein [Pseudomonadota bacterium]MCL2307592.1 ATP-binding protein [Pseudomonadota bacterium]
MLFERHADAAIRKLSTMFGAVLVTGARQVGKTTLLRDTVGHTCYVTLDEKFQLIKAIEQSGVFFKDNPPPVFVDEVQYAQNLFPQIKLILDKEKRKGQFFLSGSQQFEMMKNVRESLAGRLGILVLPGLSLRELYGISFREPFLPSEGYFLKRVKEKADIRCADVWNIIHRGSFPELCANPDFDWQMFFAAYVKTYIERDVRDLAQVSDEVKFMRFMMVAASRTGQLLNLASLASDVGISQPTAERWLSILVTSNLAYLLAPYHNNVAKRAIKTPKLYFLDTGLAAYLTRWNTPDVIKNGAMAGALFETFVVSEIIKSYANRGILNLPLYFYRDRDGNEIDLLIEDNGSFYPVEIKKHADPSTSDISTFSILDKIPSIKRGAGGVVCLYENLETLQGQNRIIPINML